MPLSAEAKAKVVKQVEFYFSDVNLAKDTFLKTKMAENAEGFVGVGVLLTFKRLATLVESEADQTGAVVEALKDSTALVVDTAAAAVRRREALPESITTDAETIYVKPVPADSTLEELQQFFGQFGNVRAVWRRALPGAKTTDGSKGLKNSVFVVFDSTATVEKLSAEAPSFKGEQLTVMPKSAYLASKAGPARPAREAQAAALKTPPMPTDASVEISGVGTFEGFKAVKSLWSADLHNGIRYVSLNEARDAATVIFQDTATADRMSADVTDKGTTLNGKVPTFRRLSRDEDAAATAAAEKEICDRAAAKAAEGGRGRGRGRGRGGRGRGGGMRGKRQRD